MIDLHCHLLPGLDDGAPDLQSSHEMAQTLVSQGYTTVAPSPHFGEGPGGDVSAEEAYGVRQSLQASFDDAGIPLKLLANGEHHVTPKLFERIDKDLVTTIAKGQWLLIELPWQSIPNVEDTMFRLQAKGLRLLLAHPERCDYLDLDIIQRIAQRGVRMQLEIGSFVKIYGTQVAKRAATIMEAGLGHVLATDLHRPLDGSQWIETGLTAIGATYGEEAVRLGTQNNPKAIVDNAAPSAVISICTP